MGSVPKGLTEEEIDLLPTALYGDIKAELPFRGGGKVKTR